MGGGCCIINKIEKDQLRWKNGNEKMLGIKTGGKTERKTKVDVEVRLENHGSLTLMS